MSAHLALPERCVSFCLDDDLYGIDVLRVREVLPRPGLTTVPGAGELCVGVMNLRGRILTVLNLRRLLGLSGEGSAEGHLLVIERAGRLVGLLVDRIGEVLRLNGGADATTAGLDRAAIQAMLHHQGRYVALLSLDQLLDGTP